MSNIRPQTMELEPERSALQDSPGYRLLSVALGSALTGSGAYVLYTLGPIEVVPLVAGVVLVVLGFNLLYCGCTGKPSWLSKVGPLP